MEFLSEHWVLIYGMFMYGMGLLTGSIKKKRQLAFEKGNPLGNNEGTGHGSIQ